MCMLTSVSSTKSNTQDRGTGNNILCALYAPLIAARFAWQTDKSIEPMQVN